MVTDLSKASELKSCDNCHDSASIADSLSLAHRQSPRTLTRETVLRHRIGQQTLRRDLTSSCTQCHGGTLSLGDGGLINGAGIQSGRNPEACSDCHGEIVLHNRQEFAPGETFAPADSANFSGALFSGQGINASAINVTDKAARSDPFDIHLARGMVCSDCHRAGNRPGIRTVGAALKETHLKQDPRDVSIRGYLHDPDHSLSTTLQCDDCHRSGAGHSWLPFTQRHMSALACESCHIPELFGAALESIDLDSAYATFRGRDEQGLVRGFTPVLLAKGDKLAPFNLIAVNFEESSEQKTSVLAVPQNHGVVRDAAHRDCATCHWPEGLTESLLSLGESPTSDPPVFVAPAEVAAPAFEHVGGELQARSHPESASRYMLGAKQLAWADRIGMLIAAGTLAAVLLHGVARFLASRRRGVTGEARKRVYMYGVYERFWHWLQATAILILLVTGAAIHKPYLFGFLNFAYMVALHNLVGLILLVNAILAAFYHLASGEVRQYLPGTSDLFGRMFLQARYYTRGIFRGDPHPFAKDAQHKLNPLQQITYFGLLNTLLPAQIVTGILMWGAQHWPSQTTALGGLAVLGPLHSFMAWLFAAFLIMHIYLTTTSGPKPLSGIQAMLEGWEDVEESAGGDTL
ncbi:cytochrome b/b6 domain-containing protein [Congregibacter litoralis]|uniref:cytochrome b/b6 domain-containing protein n=1 Tax=Congregibacter litoralis TaxID=393662 RepID=UPI0003233902|nr:cytochrome b/b6 domain-containing protein [Congregibacter litoralis]